MHHTRLNFFITGLLSFTFKTQKKDKIIGKVSETLQNDSLVSCLHKKLRSKPLE